MARITIQHTRRRGYVPTIHLGFGAGKLDWSGDGFATDAEAQAAAEASLPRAAEIERRASAQFVAPSWRPPAPAPDLIATTEGTHGGPANVSIMRDGAHLLVVYKFAGSTSSASARDMGHAKRLADAAISGGKDRGYLFGARLIWSDK